MRRTKEKARKTQMQLKAARTSGGKTMGGAGGMGGGSTLAAAGAASINAQSQIRTA